MGIGQGSATRPRGWRLALAVWCLVAAGGVAGRAQISPGELSAAHAGLEGGGSCLECHGQRRGVGPTRCLDCHELLADRIAAGEGLHARPEYAECATCHIEHHGREFELVWWGDGGEASFDHDLAGYELVGAHAETGCRDCHRPESITAAADLERRHKDLRRTFLGLEPACLACHRDEHRGQADGDGCLTCHTMAAWMPPSKFDHDRSRFALTGRHRDVECASCHAMVEPPDGVGEPHLRFAVAAFQGCADCHRDPHQSRLGGDCSSCHETAGWRRVERAAFDHGRTRFPLEGRHRGVDCAGCHRPGEPPRVARFERCRDCHDEAHQGQFDRRADGGGCESCHLVDGFRPATFSVEDHQSGGYPLVGAHLAVACDACHERLDGDRLAELLGRPAKPDRGGPATAIRFRFAATACSDCHADPHREEVGELVRAGGCETCHSLAGWASVEFDHQLTGYPLSGGHLGPGCGECHETAEAPVGEARIRLAAAAAVCVSCHADRHRGQFALAGEVACERCHGVVEWSASRFDHQADATFPLEGAHRDVECGRCHEPEGPDGDSFVRYKPLPTSCAGCHGEGPAGVGDVAVPRRSR